MTNTSAPETTPDAPDAKEPAAPAPSLDDDKTLETSPRLVPPESDGEAAAEKSDGEGKAEALVAEKPPRPEVAIRLFGRTDVGQVREHNEDNFLVADLTRRAAA
jgi:hypothetical protein